MSKSTGFILFLAGAAIGAVTAWKFAKTKYEALAQSEIDSVKEVYSKKEEESKLNAAMVKEYSNIIDVEGYDASSEKNANIAKCVSDDEYEDTPISEAPYVIAPDDFATNFEYETIEITYYADGVLADECDEPLEYVENTVGKAAVNHFGEYENDTVYVRNDRLKCDFEIVKDLRKYSDIKSRKPHQMEE